MQFKNRDSVSLIRMQLILKYSSGSVSALRPLIAEYYCQYVLHLDVGNYEMCVGVQNM